MITVILVVIASAGGFVGGVLVGRRNRARVEAAVDAAKNLVR